MLETKVRGPSITKGGVAAKETVLGDPSESKGAVRARNLLSKSFCMLLLSSAALLGQAPVLFYSDLTSAPNAGGENNNGAYVTVYGNYLGTSQGSSSISVGGGAMVNCWTWGATFLWYQKITCQLGPGAVTGNIAVSVNGQSSNTLPFAVAPGNIYFVSPTGNDHGAGSFTAPWLTLLEARDTMQPGDITYAMNGVTQSTDDGTGWDSAFLLSGGGQGKWCSPTGSPRALVAYPGATVTIGNSTGGLPDFGLRTSDCQGNWVFSGISFRGQNPALTGFGVNYRFIASDITCPYTLGTGGSACFETSQSSAIYFYGNHVYNAGASNASALFQGVYFSTDSNAVDMGWNLVENVHGCRGVQVHSSPLGSGGASDPTGHDQYNISIHDNTIHDTQCDGLIVDTVNPSEGPVTVYNNVIYNAGIGPNNPENTGGWNCINIPGSTANGPAGSGTIEIFNNTLYSCGTYDTPPYENANNAIAENGDEAKGAPAIYLHIRNDLMDQVTTSLFPAGVPYVVIWDPVTGEPCTDSQVCPWLFGANNLMYGAGSPVEDLTEITATVSANPLLVSTSIPDLHLTAGSPAIQAGAVIGSVSLYGVNNTGRDHDGLQRGLVPSIGAYELYGSTGGNPTVTVTPPGASLVTGQTQQFSATVAGGGNNAVTWSMNPAFGTLTALGLYTAPSSAATPQSVAITATSVANPGAWATATVVVNPTPIAIALTPAAASLNASQTLQFTATVTGTTNTAATWSISPTLGTLSASGLYTAPSTISNTQVVTVTAASAADLAVTATAKVTLLPAGAYTLSFTLVGGTSVQVNWKSPGGGLHDWIGLSSVGSPDYWYLVQQKTSGAATGSFVTPLPATGIWVFRYFLGNTYRIAAASPQLSVGVSGFSVTGTPATVSAGSPVNVLWTAPSGRAPGDSVELFAAGVSDLYPIYVQYLSGAAGTFEINAPSTPGQYQLRYLMSGNGWVAAALSSTITVP